MLFRSRLAADNKGIDALRCDFGQGLPNPLWEYVINKTRSAKWNFVFMAETLDGAEPGYRSNRVFDILNENMVFNFTASHLNKEYDIQSNLESRRSTYRTGAILLNITGHDEVLPDNDAWLNATRYGAMAAVPGLPMAFYGQEQGIQNFNQGAGTSHYDGFETDHELNFDKRIPHFKKWNRAQFWYPATLPPNNTGMAQWYGRVNWARLNSPAIKSLNQYYLDSKIGGGAPADNIFAIAKYEQANASPAFKDVVLCFANLFAHNASTPGTGATTHLNTTSTFDIRGGTGDPLWNLLGLRNTSDRSYQVRNLASSNASANVWNTPRTGADLYSNGIFVGLGGGTTNAITSDGELVQYLKIIDVTPPPSSPPQTNYYAIGSSITFTWASTSGVDDNVTSYLVEILNGNTVVTSTTVSETSYTFTAAVAGTTYRARVTAISNAGISSTSPGSSDTGPPNPASATTSAIALLASADQDGDGRSNVDEQTAGTNPLDASSLFEVLSITRTGPAVTVSFSSVNGKSYQLETSTTLGALSWNPIGSPLTATGAQSSLSDPTGGSDPKRFYRVRVSGP